MGDRVNGLSYTIDHDRLLSITFEAPCGTLKFVPRTQCRNDENGHKSAEAELEKQLDDLKSHLADARSHSVHAVPVKRAYFKTGAVFAAAHSDIK